MKEEFLHYVWKHKLFSDNHLQSSLKKSIVIVKNGSHNRSSGPDFLNAHIKIDNQYWSGNVEIHVNSSDWYAQKHEIDTKYDAVILHVVWECDAVVFMKNNQPIPTLVLRDLVDKNVLKKYNNLQAVQSRWILCQRQIHTIDSFTFSQWKECLFFERLKQKSNAIDTVLRASKNNYEAVLFQLLAKNFGLKVNG
jgi:hypothetical protein